MLLSESNRSLEHIIPNAIGGHLKSKDLICKNCNSNTGQKIDAEISKQLNFFANMLNIERDRGKPQEFKIKDGETGELYRCLPGGVPSRIKPKVIKKNDQLIIKAPDKKIAKQILNKYIGQNLSPDINQIINNAEISREYINNWCNINISFGGADTFKSIYKTALSFYIYSGGNPYCITKDSEEVLHSILIKGNKEIGKLYCYIEYFNAFKYAILLDNYYNGDDLNYTYIYNVLNRQEISEEKIVSTWVSDVHNLFNNLEMCQTLFKDSLSKLMNIISNKQHDDHLNKLLYNALENTMNMMGLSEGDEITKEVYDVLIKNTIDSVMPYLVRFIPKE